MPTDTSMASDIDEQQYASWRNAVLVIVKLCEDWVMKTIQEEVLVILFWLN